MGTIDSLLLFYSLDLQYADDYRDDQLLPPPHPPSLFQPSP